MSTKDTEQSPVPAENTETVRQNLDRRIAYARQMVERLCVAKAKAETLGLLEAPHRDLEMMIFG